MSMADVFMRLAGVSPGELAHTLAIAGAAGVACGAVALTTVWVFLNGRA